MIWLCESVERSGGIVQVRSVSVDDVSQVARKSEQRVWVRGQHVQEISTKVFGKVALDDDLANATNLTPGLANLLNPVPHVAAKTHVPAILGMELQLLATEVEFELLQSMALLEVVSQVDS